MISHILQSKEWAEFRLKTPTVKKVLQLGSQNRVFQIFFHKIPYIPEFPNLPNTIAYLPRSVMPTRTELNEIKKMCLTERALFLKIEPLAPSEIEGPHRISSPVLPRHTIYIDLTQSEESLLSNMHEKTRYNLRLAEKKGVTVSEGEDLEKFIELLEKTEERQNFYSHPKNYYRVLWKTLRPYLMVYLLSALPYAAIMLLRYKDFLYYAFGGSDPKYRELMAPHLLHWEAIKLGRKLGCRVYDLWGSYKNSPNESDPWWGIYRFKKGFGGREITFPPTIDIPLSPLYTLYPLLEKFRGLTK